MEVNDITCRLMLPTNLPTETPISKLSRPRILEKDKIEDFGPYLIFFVKSILELLKEVGRLVGWMLTGVKRKGEVHPYVTSNRPTDLNPDLKTFLG